MSKPDIFSSTFLDSAVDFCNVSRNGFGLLHIRSVEGSAIDWKNRKQILEDSAKGYDSLSYEIRGLKSSKDGLVSKADKELKDKKAVIMNVYYDLAKNKIEKESAIRMLGMELDNHIKAGQQAKADLDRARQDYQESRKWNGMILN